MIEKIIRLSVEHKWVVGLLVLFLIGTGIYSAQHINLDAVPDITNNQVQVVTVSPSLSTQEMERIITHPLERSLSNLPDVVGLRSISKYGLSVITVIFDEKTPVLDARQYVREQLDVAREEIPPGFGSPQLMPITTGLGEVYQYVLRVDPEYRDRYDEQSLRTIQDWLVKRQLAGIPGVVEISSFGGSIKEYEVAVDPHRLTAAGFTIQELTEVLQSQNRNSGGGYLTVGEEALYLRLQGFIENLDEVATIAIGERHGTPIYLRDVASVRWGNAPRFGAMTMDGKGEAVGGIALMLKNENAYDVVKRVEDRMEEVSKSLPEGVTIYPYLNRSNLVERTIRTAGGNLLEGGLIVLLVLMLLLGNGRAGLIVASVIPLSMLFALNLMNLFGVSANLMSLGAIDFGIVVDGAVIVVENILHVLAMHYAGRKLSKTDFNAIVGKSAANIYKTAAFGVLIILIVFVPILTLQGVEGKMFRPMAMTVVFAISGAFLLSLTYVPAVSALFLKHRISTEPNWSEKWVSKLRQRYLITLRRAMKHRALTLGGSLGLLILAIIGFNRMGSVFTPTLEEGDLAIQLALPAGSSLEQSIATSTRLERILLQNFPEVEHVVSKIGSAEIPTDPMSIEDADIMVLLKPKSEWTSASNREELVDQMKRALEPLNFASTEFTQPIQLRFNELMTGSKSDLALSIFGEDLDTLAQLGSSLAQKLESIEGAADVVVEKTEGLPQLQMTVNRQALARYGIPVDDVASLIQSAYSGAVMGQIYENERRFDWVIRLDAAHRTRPQLDALFLRSSQGQLVPASAVVTTEYINGPVQISREHAQRKITVGVNVRGRDLVSVVTDMENILQESGLPPGYSYKIGGEFEKLRDATRRLSLAVPLALASILLLLYLTFNNIQYALMIYSAIPLSAIGGIALLMVRGMPFSISAAVGFIALFGVSVLNGIVLIASFLDLMHEEPETPLEEIIERGASSRIRPVIMTASVAALGFIPMAFSSSAGAEVQKPLATVVIGGLVTATFLTLFVLPVLFRWVASRHHREAGSSGGRKSQSKAAPAIGVALVGLMLLPSLLSAQNPQSARILTLEEAVSTGLKNSFALRHANLTVDAMQSKKNNALLPDPLQLNYTRGQIDGPEATDYQWQVSQNLGSIPAVVAELKSARLAVDAAEANRSIQTREVELEIELTWNTWSASYQQMVLLDTIRSLHRRRVGLIEAIVQRGEADLYAEIQAEKLLLDAENQFRQAFADYQSASRQLREILVVDGWDFRPPPIEIMVFDVNPQGVNPLLLEKHQFEVMAQESRVKSQQGYWFPQLSVGYMNQQLNQISGYTGWMLGAQFPLWPITQRDRVQQEQIVLNRAQINLEQQERQYNYLLGSLIDEWESLLGVMNFSNTPAVQSDNLQKLEQQHQQGIVDPTDYLLKLTTVYERDINRIQWIAQYNACLLQIKFLAL